MNPFLSLCMILKNEESVIARCLDSVAGIVDEIVIVDTGSEDRTIEIARNYTDSIYSFEWINDFAAARNYASAQAHGEWILIMDADEFVDRENLQDVIQAIRQAPEEDDSYSVKIFNFVGTYGEQVFQHSNIRIYRNHRGIRFERSIHEQLVAEDHELGYQDCGLILYHSGYLNKTVDEKKKGERNAPLVKKELEVSRHKGFDYFNLGNEYFSANKIEEALDAFKQAYTHKKAFEYSWIGICVIQMINCLIRLERYQDALDIIRDGEKIWTRTADFPCLKANVYLLQDRYEDAEEVLKQLLFYKDLYNQPILNVEFTMSYPHKLLGILYAKKKDYANSAKSFINALQFNRLDINVISDLMTLLAQYGAPHDCEELISRYNWMHERKIMQVIIQTLLANHKLETCLQLAGHLQDPVLKKGLSIKRKLLQGKWRDALIALQSETVENINLILQSACLTYYDLVLVGLNQNSIAFLQLISKLAQGDHGRFILFLLKEESGEHIEDFYLSLLATCIYYEQFETFEQLLERRGELSEGLDLKIGHLLYEKGFKGIAVDFYLANGIDQLDRIGCTHIMESFIEKGLREDLLEFANHCLYNGKHHYSVIRLALQEIAEQNELDRKNRLIKEALSFYPDSNWLKGQYRLA
ncbi:tetratricopeptide repeat-containing glycosyltransferase family 2 protein [Gorillibacterium sp. sgz500922]|uniref:tetratricopeptide repeat-containing glycosyltransferase family 2 protein n=1 Tax=Gorillibacterium sp. sgz500922 TaxID=3446694 RepID=UPI003F67A2D6